MAKMHQKTIVESDKRLHKISGAIPQNTPELARALQGRLGDDGWSVAEDSLEEVTRSLLRVLEARNQRLGEAVCDRQAVADRGRECRARRDEASREVYDLVVSLRRRLHGALGDRGVRAYFGKGKTPREPREVWRLALSLRRRIRDDDSRAKMYGKLETEEGLLRWYEALEEPLHRLGLYLWEVRKIGVEEPRAVRAVEKAKTEMAETERYVYRLLDGLYGLAGAEEIAKRLRVKKSRSSAAANDGLVRRTTRTSASEPAGRRATGEAAAPAVVERPGAEARSATPPSNETAEPTEPRDLRSARRAAAGCEIASRRPERSRCGTVPGAVADLEDVPAATAPPVGAETEPSEATKPRVWNVFKLFQAIPHRVRNADDSGESAASEEKAA